MSKITEAGSIYQVSLEPPVGTSYFKQHKTAVTQTFTLLSGRDYYWTADITIDFYIYVTLKKPTDKNFTADGGKVYVVAKYSGGIYLHSTSSGSIAMVPFTEFKYGLEDATSTQLLSPVKDLPNAGYEAKVEDLYTYGWDYSQTMSMFKSNGTDTVNFTAVDREDFTRAGWTQRPVTNRTYQGFECKLVGNTQGNDPMFYGLQVWESDSLGKASLKISSTISRDGYDDNKSDKFELDFSVDTMKNSSA